MKRVATDLLVVGGGPAGMSAAIAAARAGVRCILVDEAEQLGGQIYRVPTPAAPPGVTPHRRGQDLRARVAALHPRIEPWPSSAVWGIFEGRKVALSSGDETRCVQAREIVVATGAYEFVPPFPGWTLPGVMTPGAAQILAKTMGVVPGRRVLLAGTGPFLLAVGAQLTRLGVDVHGILEASPRSAWRRLPLQSWRTPGYLLEGLRYLRALRSAGVPVHHGRIVTRAEGAGSLAAVTHAPVDAQWNPDVRRSRTDEVDTLCIGYGFVPRIHLVQLLGCALECRPELGGWVPRRNASFMTSVDGVFAVGDGAGVAGALVAELEGELAGLAVAQRLGALPLQRLRRRQRVLCSRLRRISFLRRALDGISAPRPGLESLVTGDTIVCRCEELCFDELRRGIENGGTRYRSLKVMTRLGMGPCQGRFCWPAASRQVAGRTGCSLEEVGPSSPRPPVRPVTLGALASLERAP